MNIYIKNGLIYAIYAIATILYFKLLLSNIDSNILAEYFYYKAVGLGIALVIGFKYSDIAYFLKAARASLYSKIIGIYFVVYIILAMTIICVVTLVNWLDLSVVLFIVISSGIFLFEECIESYVNVCRLYDKYKILFWIRLSLFLKVFFFVWFDYNNLVNLLYFEICFLFLQFVFIYGFNAKNVTWSISNEVKYIKAHRHILYNSWLIGISKLSYDVLPQVLLAKSVTDIVFIEYNIARKLLSLFGNSVQPFLQVLVAKSLNYKENFTLFVLKYWLVILPFSISVFIFTIFNFEFVITSLAKDDYITESLFDLFILSWSLFIIYLVILPIKYYLTMNIKLKSLSMGLIMISIVSMVFSYPIVLTFHSLGALSIQGTCMTLALVLSYFYTKISRDADA